MRQPSEFWTDRRIRIAAEKWKAGDKISEIASDFECSPSLVESLVNRRRDLFPLRTIYPTSSKSAASQ